MLRNFGSDVDIRPSLEITDIRRRSCFDSQAMAQNESMNIGYDSGYRSQWARDANDGSDRDRSVDSDAKSSDARSQKSRSEISSAPQARSNQIRK